MITSSVPLIVLDWVSPIIKWLVELFLIYLYVHCTSSELITFLLTGSPNNDIICDSVVEPSTILLTLSLLSGVPCSIKLFCEQLDNIIIENKAIL